MLHLLDAPYTDMGALIEQHFVVKLDAGPPVLHKVAQVLMGRSVGLFKDPLVVLVGDPSTSVRWVDGCIPLFDLSLHCARQRTSQKRRSVDSSSRPCWYARKKTFAEHVFSLGLFTCDTRFMLSSHAFRSISMHGVIGLSVTLTRSRSPSHHLCQPRSCTQPLDSFGSTDRSGQ